MTETLSVSLMHVLKKMKFDDFPCGKGTWNKMSNIVEDANLISDEELVELVVSKFSPWKDEYDASNETVEIKKQIIEQRNIVSTYKIKRMLRTLRLSDENISLIDEQLALLDNLVELNLSANFITSVKAKNLPKSLKVLELFGNRIDSTEFLSSNFLPKLEHLGLGFNRISSLASSFESSVIVNTLVSLDLGKNQLDDLVFVTKILLDLNNLKILILSGNPLSLFAVYRGYVIDSLKSLKALDDILISADERFSVKGMKKVQESLKRKSEIKVVVHSINNILPKNIPEDAPEEPIIKSDYYVKYWFPFPSTKSKEEIPEISHDEALSTENSNIKRYINDDECVHLHKSQNIARQNAEITFNWSEIIPVNDVSKLCEFFDENLRVEIIEETKYLYSMDNLPGKVSPRATSGNSKKKGNNRPPSKQDKPAAKPTKDAGKKKKIDESKLVVYSKTTHAIAKYLMDLSSLKTGVFSIDQHLQSEMLPDIQQKTEGVTGKKAIDKGTKGKTGSAKGERLKSSDKTHPQGKAAAKNQMTIEVESPKPIECHISVTLLNYTSTKMINGMK